MMKRAFLRVVPVVAAMAFRLPDAAAQSTPVVPTAQAVQTPMYLAYAAYVSGLNVFDLRARLEFSPRGYRLQLGFNTTGVVGTFFHAESDSVAAGLWDGAGVAPERMYSYGIFRGEPHRTQIEFIDRQPVVRIMEPENNADKYEPVPPDVSRGTVDALSAIALLIHKLAATGQCDGEVRTFDGHRVSDISVHDGGIAVLAADRGSIFAGSARRCEIVGRQVAGFWKDVAPADRGKPVHAEAWFGKLSPGGAAVPVRIVIQSRFMPNATLVLAATGPGGDQPPR